MVRITIEPICESSDTEPNSMGSFCDILVDIWVQKFEKKLRHVRWSGSQLPVTNYDFSSLL